MFFPIHKVRLIVICWLVCLAASPKAYAQENDELARPYFDHITTRQGLSANGVTALYRDTRGFLWIGTTNGLNEYDGREMKVYRHNRFDNHSLAANTINSIAEDDSGYLWIGTNQGVSRFDPYNGQSVNYSHDAHDPFSLNDNYNCHVYCDRSGTIWIGNESGVSYFDRNNHHFIHIQILPDSLNKPTLTSAGFFFEDREDRFWIATFSGLVLYDRKNHTYKAYLLNPDHTPGANAVTTIYQDHENRLWVGIWGFGLSVFDPKTSTSKSYQWNKKVEYAGTANIVFSMAETRSDHGGYTLWAASSEGLFRIDSLQFSETGTAPPSGVAVFVPDPQDPHSLSAKNVLCLLADKQKILWIGTGKGLNEYIPQNQLFSHRIKLKGSINRIWVDSARKPVRFFVATWYGNGLTELDQNLKTVHTWRRIPPNAAHSDNGQISDVLVAKNGAIWIGTFNGLYRYDEQSGLFTPFLHQTASRNSPASDQVTSLAEDSRGALWIGTYGHGMDRYDPVLNCFRHFRHNDKDSSGLCSDRVWNIYRDNEGRIWAATDQGLSLWDEEKRSFINYTDQGENTNSLQGKNITGFAEESDHIYWIATNKGLNRFDQEKGKFTLYAQEEGLKDDNITSLTRDDNGLLWMCAGNGISSFNPATAMFINYGEQNGLPYDVAGAMSKTPSGDILAGGIDMLIKFSPADFVRTSNPPPIYITGLSVGGRRLNTSHLLSGPLPLVLHYPRNNFSAAFSAPEFFNGKAVKYAYRLDGVDALWTQAGDRNFVTYSGLPPGHYILHVKAANSEGVWNNTGVQLDVTVLPPFWKTWWFRLMIALFLALTVYGLFLYRVRSIRRKEALRTAVNKQMADMRLKVLRSRMNPHFMFNALNSIQECIYTGQTQSAYRYLSKFSRLVRMILELSEQTFITISQEIEMLQWYLQLESLRFQQSFSYEIRHDGVETDFEKIPSMLVQPFVENALWHGLLHKEGEKKLLVSFETDEHYIYITIQDNGVGREAAGSLEKKPGSGVTGTSDRNSLGIRLASEQLETISRGDNREAKVEIEDLFTEENNKHLPAGTRVTMKVPAIGSET